MNILIATDGILDPREAANTVARFNADSDSITVFTAVNVPTDFLRSLGDGGVEGAAKIAHEAGHTLGAGDRAAERLAPVMPSRPVPDAESAVVSAMSATAHARTQPIVDALRQAGVEAEAIWRSTEGRTAKVVIRTVEELGVDLLVIGSHGHGRFEGLLGSTGTKLVRHSPTAVLVLRNPTEPAPDDRQAQ